MKGCRKRSRANLRWLPNLLTRCFINTTQTPSFLPSTLPCHHGFTSDSMLLIPSPTQAENDWALHWSGLTCQINPRFLDCSKRMWSFSFRHSVGEGMQCCVSVSLLTWLDLRAAAAAACGHPWETAESRRPRMFVAAKPCALKADARCDRFTVLQHCGRQLLHFEMTGSLKIKTLVKCCCFFLMITEDRGRNV